MSETATYTKVAFLSVHSLQSMKNSDLKVSKSLLNKKFQTYCFVVNFFKWYFQKARLHQNDCFFLFFRHTDFLQCFTCTVSIYIEKELSSANNMVIKIFSSKITMLKPKFDNAKNIFEVSRIFNLTVLHYL